MSNKHPFQECEAHSWNGFTIIEAVVGMAIFLIVTGSLFGITQLVFESIGQTRVRHTARLLANEKIEEARNLSYEDLGTVGGIPAGPIAPIEQVSLGGIIFEVTTTIAYVDDPFDGEAPADLVNTDYKRVRVKLEWAGAFASGRRPVVLVTDIVPKEIETNDGGGTLSLLVFNSEGNPLNGADVNIVNSTVNPQVDLTITSDSFGRVILPGAPSAIESYEIIVTKAGYSSDRTYGAEEVTNSSKSHITVLEGQVSEASFAIDKVSTLTVKTYGSRLAGFPILTNVELRVRGEKIIGNDETESPIYKFDELVSTNAGGTYTFSNMEFDSYMFEVVDVSYDLAGSNPALPIGLNADEQLSIDLSLAPDSPGDGSLLVLVADSGDVPLSSSTARLINGLLSYDETIESGDEGDPDFGHAFFNSLNAAAYELTISLTGYEDATSSIQINEDVFTTIILNQK